MPQTLKGKRDRERDREKGIKKGREKGKKVAETERSRVKE